MHYREKSQFSKNDNQKKITKYFFHVAYSFVFVPPISLGRRRDRMRFAEENVTGFMSSSNKFFVVIPYDFDVTLLNGTVFG